MPGEARGMAFYSFALDGIKKPSFHRRVGKRSSCPPSIVTAWATLRFCPPYWLR